MHMSNRIVEAPCWPTRELRCSPSGPTCSSRGQTSYAKRTNFTVGCAQSLQRLDSTRSSFPETPRAAPELPESEMVSRYCSPQVLNQEDAACPLGHRDEQGNSLVIVQVLQEERGLHRRRLGHW